MSDDLAANAATWVPPWQRPASGGEAAAQADDDQAGESAPSDGGEAERTGVDEALPRQWAGLSGAKWQDTAPEAVDDETDQTDETEAVDDETEAVDDAVDAAYVPEAVDDAVDAPDVSEADSLEALDGAADVSDVPEAAEAAEPDESDVDDAGDDVAEAPIPVEAEAPIPVDVPVEVAAEAAVEVAEPAGEALFAVPEQRVSEVDAAPPAGLDESEIMSALEAILMVVDEPVSEITLAQVLEVRAEQVANALIDLSAAYSREGRGFDLRRAAGGWRFYTRSDYAPYVEKFVLDGQQMRLTQASLETLAVIAYKQPVSRSRVSAIRGVNCDGVIRTLITRGMIEECGTDPDSGAHLYRTTTLFLEKLGLDSVEQLPPLAPFLPDNLDEVASGG